VLTLLLKRKVNVYRSYELLNEYFMNTALSKKKPTRNRSPVELDLYHQGLLFPYVL
jgi:hypothetical protein